MNKKIPAEFKQNEPRMCRPRGLQSKLSTLIFAGRVVSQAVLYNTPLP